MGAGEQYKGDGLLIGWAMFVLALAIGALCVQHGDAGRLTTPSGEMSAEQIDELEADVLDMMLDAGWPPERIQCVRRRFNCDYRPGIAEGCDELEDCSAVGPERQPGR